MTEDQRIVRGAWKSVRLQEDYGWHFYFGGIETDDETDLSDVYFYVEQESTDEAAAWSAARAFTDEHREKIRQVEEEIAWLDARREFDKDSKWLRIEAREQAVLAELKRGWKTGE